MVHNTQDNHKNKNTTQYLLDTTTRKRIQTTRGKDEIKIIFNHTTELRKYTVLFHLTTNNYLADTYISTKLTSV